MGLKIFGWGFWILLNFICQTINLYLNLKLILKYLKLIKISVK